MSSSTEQASAAEPDPAASAAARSLLAHLQRGATLPDDLLQSLFLAVARAYVAEIGGMRDAADPSDPALTATETMVLTTAVLKAADLQLFELGMWQALGSPA